MKHPKEFMHHNGWCPNNSDLHIAGPYQEPCSFFSETFRVYSVFLWPSICFLDTGDTCASEKWQTWNHGHFPQCHPFPPRDLSVGHPFLLPSLLSSQNMGQPSCLRSVSPFEVYGSSCSFFCYYIFSSFFLNLLMWHISPNKEIQIKNATHRETHRSAILSPLVSVLALLLFKVTEFQKGPSMLVSTLL